MFKYALVALGVTAGSLAPRPVAAQRDSVVAELSHRDSSSTLTLTSREVVFRFTRGGVDRVGRQVDSTSTTLDWSMTRLVRRSVVDALRGIRMGFDLRDIESARTDGATVYIRFRTRSDQNSFDFDATDAKSAEAFVKRLNELLAERKR